MKKAVILIGLPLAGKTTWIKNNIVNHKIISADEIKESHKDYDPENTETLHEWSVYEAENLMNIESDSGINLVMDTGGINNSYTFRIIKMLKSKDYNVHLVHIKTPYNICLERNKIRKRKVPEKSIINKAVKENAQFYRLLAIVDEETVINYFSNKHIFVDMDGVIAALSTLPIIDGEIDFVNGEVHKYLKPVNIIINILKKLENNGHILYILSATPTSISFNEKNEWLDSNFNIKKDHRFFVNRGIYKAEMLEGLSKKLKLKKQDMLMLDDLHDTLYKVKDRGMNSMHPSELLTINN